MLRELRPYLLLAAAVAAAGGAAYGAALIDAALVYLTLLVTGIIVLVGYARWDDRHHA